MPPLRGDETTDVGARYIAPGYIAPGYIAPTPQTPATLGTIIGQFKSAVTRRARHTTPIWQRNYHDHIIRNEESLREIREYIHNNPLRWELDRNHPGNV